MYKGLKKITAILATLITISGLTSCGGSKEEEIIDNVPKTFDHYYSDRVSFASMGITISEENHFMEDGVAKLKIKSVTDGDTAIFHLNGESDDWTNPLRNPRSYITVRFLAIDTPESTSSIDPWGKKASAYVKGLLENAEGIIVDASSIDTSNKEIYPDDEAKYQPGVRLDSNGTRWLAMIWYCPDGGDPDNYNNYRSLQLDVIEECYSFYTGNIGETNYCYYADKKNEPKLYSRYEDVYGSLKLSDILFEADLRMSKLQQRYTGAQTDPNYDYSKTPYKCENRKESIKDAYDHWDEYCDQGKFIALTGVITAFIGNNFYFEDSVGTSLYVYMGINGKSIGDLFSVGDTIEIRGRLAVYGGQKQMSDIVWKKETFTKITDEADVISMPAPIELTPSNFDAKYLDSILGRLVNVKGMSATTLGSQSKDKSFTLNTSDKVTYYDENDKPFFASNYGKMGIRVNGTLAPEYSYDEFNQFKNKTVDAYGIMGVYSEMDLQAEENLPSYQIVLGNRPFDAEGNLSYDITIA